MNSILIVTAHPDDEVFGCGGTIARHISNGDKVAIHFMTDGVSARDYDNSVEAQIRKESALIALNELGVDADNVTFGDFPDNQMDTVPLIKVAKSVEESLAKVKPRIIYTHFSDDLNVDHRITHQAVMTACRPQSHSTVKEIYCYEVMSSTEWNSHSQNKFNPNKHINIDDFWSKKLAALNAYSRELRAFPHSRSIEAIEALAIWRGASVGLNKAEAFQIERIIEV
ncbi:PIG-L deacetylase family protein [Vibrio fortis]|uniref:PIG-L deacetylase family protein n=1 Tax=Vibrio fortis TaxID=212667 RepID=UPI0021C268C5|nr:PIG-L family deacetylase [Vibrio fortis]